MGDNTRVDLGLRVGMLRGHPRMARGFGAPRGRRVVHRDSNPRMARGFGAPRGRRVGKAVEWPSNTTPAFMRKKHSTQNIQLMYNSVLASNESFVQGDKG